MFLGLYTFGHDIHIHRVGDVDDSGDNSDVFAVLAHILHKAFIDFKFPRREILQRQHVGVAHAKVVDGNGDPDATEIVKYLHAAVKAVKRGGFRKLNGQASRGNVMAYQRIADAFIKVLLFKLHRRDIQRNRPIVMP